MKNMKNMIELEEIKTEEKIKKFERTNITMFKARNGKSVTLPIQKSDFTEDDELVLNVSIKGLTDFLKDERFKSFKWNRIRSI